MTKLLSRLLRFRLVAAMILLPMLSMGQATGDYLFQRKTVGAFTSEWDTPVGTNLIRYDGSGGISSIPGSTYMTPAQVAAGYQPLSATLTALAALATTSYGRGLLTQPNAAAARVYLGIGAGSVTSVTASAPLASSGGATPNITASTSLGGNGATDSGKLLIFGTQGNIQAAASTANAVSGIAVDGTGVYGENNSVTQPAGEFINPSGPIAHFHNITAQGMEVENDGGLVWTSGTGAQTTADNLPVFGALTQGLVPAAGAVPAATNFLTETGTFAVPAGTGIQDGDVLSIGLTFPFAGLRLLENGGPNNAEVRLTDNLTVDRRFSLSIGDADRTVSFPADGTHSGTNTGDQTITLTGDVTGSGTGSFAATLATVNAGIGTFGSATQSAVLTANAKGLITAVSNTTITPAVGSITGLGTGVATALTVNTGTAGAFVVNGGALGTPSSGTLTNATGLPISSGVSGLGTGVATALGNNADSPSGFVTQTGGDARYQLESKEEIIVLDANFVNNSATYTDVLDNSSNPLAITLDANSVYQFEGRVVSSTPSNSTGVGYALTMTGSPTTRNVVREYLVSQAQANSLSQSLNADDTYSTVTSYTASTKLPTMFNGLIVTSGSSCTVTLRVIRGGASNNVTTYAGSFLKATKLP